MKLTAAQRREAVAILKELNPRSPKPTHVNFVGAGVWPVDLSEDIVRRIRALLDAAEITDKG